MSGHGSRETLGWWLGLLGVAIFALTVPMTRLATGAAEAPQLSPWFVAAGRAVLAAALSITFLLATRSPWPQRAHWLPLAVAAAGNCIGFPLLLGLALRQVTASHAAVVMAPLPLATAVVAALVLRQRASAAFWLCAVSASAVVLLFSWLRGQQAGQGYAPAWADLLLLGAVLCAALGYAYGARVTAALGAERVICWVCVLALPVTLPGALWFRPESAVEPVAWLGFGYVGVFSMWAGFFAWYRGLQYGGVMRVSQLQALQPFLSIVFAVPLLGEALDLQALGFAAAVVASVLLSRRTRVGTAARPLPTASSTPSSQGQA